MTNKKRDLIRKFSLWVMIITILVAVALLYLSGQLIWGIFWSCVIFLVGGFEIYAYVFCKKKLISGMWWEWSEKKPILAHAVLFLIWISLNALVIHLL